MTLQSSMGQMTYLSQLRQVEAQSGSVKATDENAAVGYWDGRAIARAPQQNISYGLLSSTLTSAGASGEFSVGSDQVGRGFALLSATFSTSDPTLLSFSGSYDNFVSLDLNSFTFSISGAGYNYSFTGDPRAEFQEFSQANIALSAGTYTVELRVETIGFNDLTGEFDLAVTPVPAPGAAGVALVGAGALAGRRRREE